MSRTAKNIIFSPYLQDSKLAIVLWMLTEDMRYLGQRQRRLLHTAEKAA